MAIELNFTNNLTKYTNAYVKIIKYTDNATNRTANVQMGFFVKEKDSHSTARLLMVDEIIYRGEEYNEIVENYGDDSSTSRKIAYEKIMIEYEKRWKEGEVKKKQNEVAGIERPYRDEVLAQKSEKDADFVAKGQAYESDPSAENEAEAKEKLKEVVMQQREYHDVIYGENDEYIDVPIQYSDDFEVALSQMPEAEA